MSKEKDRKILNVPKPESMKKAELVKEVYRLNMVLLNQDDELEVERNRSKAWARSHFRARMEYLEKQLIEAVKKVQEEVRVANNRTSELANQVVRLKTLCALLTYENKALRSILCGPLELEPHSPVATAVEAIEKAAGDELAQANHVLWLNGLDKDGKKLKGEG